MRCNVAELQDIYLHGWQERSTRSRGRINMARAPRMGQAPQGRNSSDQRQGVTNLLSQSVRPSSCKLHFLDLRSSCLQYCSYPTPFARGYTQVMLRLRPSELTLTPEDIDETFRRMAQKQALNGSRHVSAHPSRPMLRRGPQRAVRDAITTLGNIPILRPQPQQAIFTSIDEDLENDPEPQTPSPRRRVDSVSGSASPVQREQTTSGNASTDGLSALPTLHLPFRLRRSHGGSPTHSSDMEHNFEGATVSPRYPSSRIMEDNNGATDRGATGQHSLQTHLATSSSPAELRGGGRSRKDRKHNSSASQEFGPSRPQQVRDRDVPSDEENFPNSVDAEGTASDEQPTILLKRYFTDPGKYPKGPAYWFEEHRRQTPQTEPRRSSGRHAMPVRSLSSTSASAYPRFTQPPAVRDASSDDVFGNSAGYTPFSTAEARQFSSEASSTSAAYSIYDLPPESRQSSGQQSESAQHSYFQYDGSAASESGSRGAYRSVRPSDLQRINNSKQHPVTSSSYGGQYGISPLPSMPYKRTQSTHASPQAFARNRMSGAVTTQYVDAATAAVRDLNSPLEPYSDHYQRLTATQNPRQTMPPQSSTYYPTDSFNSFVSLPPQHNITTQQNATHGSQSRRSNSGRQQQILANSNSQYPPIGSFTIDPRRPSQTTRRDVQVTRANQRSSENAPVRPPAQSSGPSRNSQVQIHRAVFERLHNASQGRNSTTMEPPRQGPSRRSLPQPEAPHSTSNEPLTNQAMRRFATHRAQRRLRTSQTSSSPTQAREQPPSSQTGSSPPAFMPRALTGAPPRPPPPNEPHIRGGGARRRITPMTRSPPLLQPPRNYPSASIAPGRASTTAVLRSPLLHLATSARPFRRVPPQQRDQENSGAGEEQLMRQEEAAINARYGEGVQQDTMDETPPRVGRVERRMFS
jgi:hypothetical protein